MNGRRRPAEPFQDRRIYQEWQIWEISGKFKYMLV